MKCLNCGEDLKTPLCRQCGFDEVKELVYVDICDAITTDDKLDLRKLAKLLSSFKSQLEWEEYMCREKFIDGIMEARKESDRRE